MQRALLRAAAADEHLGRAGAVRRRSLRDGARVSATSVRCTSAGAYDGLACRAQPRAVEVVAAGALRAAAARSKARRAARRAASAIAAAGTPRRRRDRTAAPVWRSHQASSSVLPGPVSKPRTAPSAGRSVTLAMPPRLTTTRCDPSLPNSAAWNAGTSGAPWPPAATSRLRKSATTVDAGTLGEPRRIGELQRVPEVGAVANRLAVQADRARRRGAATPAARSTAAHGGRAAVHQARWRRASRGAISSAPLRCSALSSLAQPGRKRRRARGESVRRAAPRNRRAPRRRRRRSCPTSGRCRARDRTSKARYSRAGEGHGRATARARPRAARRPPRYEPRAPRRKRRLHRATRSSADCAARC